MSSYPPNPPQPPSYGPPQYQPQVPPPPSKKANLFFIIGGGCLLVLVLALATCTIGMRSCAHFVRRNPDVLVRKVIEMANPNLEVISIDKDRNVIKVYDKNSKKTLTLDMEDAKKGHSRVIGDDGTNISLNGDNNQGKVEITDGKGGQVSFTGESATTITESWIPSYPGSSKLGAMKSTQNGKKSGTYRFKSNDDVKQVISFYDEKLNSDGFKINKTSYDANGESGGSVTGEKGGRTIAVTAAREGSETDIVITFSEQ